MNGELLWPHVFAHSRGVLVGEAADQARAKFEGLGWESS
jgi:hypothetical protein